MTLAIQSTMEERIANGTKLRLRRQILGLTMKQMGEKLDCSESCISQWESGKRQPYSWIAIGRLLDLIEAEAKAKPGSQ